MKNVGKVALSIHALESRAPHASSYGESRHAQAPQLPRSQSSPNVREQVTEYSEKREQRHGSERGESRGRKAICDALWHAFSVRTLTSPIRHIEDERVTISGRVAARAQVPKGGKRRV